MQSGFLGLVVGMLAILDRTALDAILLARPHPEVDHLTSLGAERPMGVRLRVIGWLFAYRTAHIGIKELRGGGRQCRGDLLFDLRLGGAIGSAAIDQEIALVHHVDEALKVTDRSLS